MTNLTQQFNLNNVLAEALETYMTDFIVGDSVVYNDQICNDAMYSIKNVYQDDLVCLYNPKTGYVDKVPMSALRQATITEIKNKKREAEAVALFVSDVDLHYQRALKSQSEVS